MYSVYAFGTMIKPGARVDAYLAALRKAIQPGCTVMDLGCGTGFFSVMACRLGAGRVYAIEPDAAIAVAKEIAMANGCTDRIEFIQDLSVNVSLPQKVDVIVSDLRGVLPLFQKHIPSIVDARARLLRVGGTQIAKKDTLWAAPVQSDELHRGYSEPWEKWPGLDLQAGRRIAGNAWRKAKVEPASLLAEAQCWAELDYRTVTSPNVTGKMAWRAAHAGNCHGFALWFDAELCDGVTFSNAPDKPELVYGQAFFPLAEPVVLAPGDAVALDLRAQLVGDDYIWVWNTEVRAAGRDAVKVRHAQSSFYSAAATPQTLRKREMGFQPSLAEEGDIVASVLRQMTGTASLDQIARELALAYPKRFSSVADALRFAGDLAVKYSR